MKYQKQLLKNKRFHGKLIVIKRRGVIMKKLKGIIGSMLVGASFVLAACGNNPKPSDSANTPNSSISGEVQKYNIIFTTNGGTLSSRVLSDVAVGEDVSAKLPKPTKNGYSFDTWCTDEALTKVFDGIMPNNELILYARYTAKDIAVTLHYNSDVVADETINAKYGTILSLEEPKRNNATFMGWYVDDTYINLYDNTIPISAAIDLYARWKFDEGTTIYVSANGTPSGAGTEASPLDIYTAAYSVAPGVTINLKKETYNLSRRVILPYDTGGTKNKMVTINGNGAEFDFKEMALADSNRGVQINGDYYHLKNMTIKRAGDNGVLVGGSNNIVEGLILTENRDTGLQISRFDAEKQPTIETWPANNLILNCTSFNNSDTTGENADGFAAKLTCGNNIFDGCIAYSNSDDGYDLYAKSNSGTIGTIIIRNCLAFNNGLLTNSSSSVAGDGNGFKLGGSNMSGHVIVENSAAWGNQSHGFTDNSNPGTIIIRNCTAFNNGLSDHSKDNFNLARNSSKANNCYYGLLSFDTNSSKYINGDDVRGAISNSILRFTFTADQSENVGTKYYAFNDYFEANSIYDTACGKLISDLDANIFASITMPNIESDLHSLLRNSDGTINLGDYLKLVDDKLLTYASGKRIGANLQLSNQSEYDKNLLYFNEDAKDIDLTDDVNAMLNQAYKFLYTPYINEAVYKNFKLPSAAYKNVTITWKSSDNKVIDASGEVFKGTAVVTRGNTDQNVVLTAKLSYTDDSGNTKSLEKEFNFVVKALAPNIGVVTGYYDQVVTASDKVIDEGSVLRVQDLNDPNGGYLEYNKDFTVETFYTDASGNICENLEIGNTYQATVIIKLTNYDIEQSITYSVNILSAITNAKITDLTGDYIIDGKVKISGSVDCVTSDIYVVAVPAGATRPNAKSIYANTVVGNLGYQKYTLTTNDFAFELNVGNDTLSCDIYAIIARNDFTIDSVNAITCKITEKKNVSAMQSISTVEEFYKMASVTDASPKAYALTCDLDFTGFDWKKVSNDYYFAGYLDGNGHTISNLNISHDYLPGIFVNIKGGIVKNLIIRNSSVTQTSQAATKGCGMLAAYLNGSTIENVKLYNVSSTGYEGVGGLVGTINSGVNNISQCSIINEEEHKVTFTYRYGGGLIGGILDDNGASKNTLTNIEVKTNVTSNSGTIAGGIVGRFKNEKIGGYLNITNALYIGTLTANKYCGGMIGSIDKATTYATITNAVVEVELAVTHTDNRTLLGNSNSDDYTKGGNTISIGTYGMGSDNCEANTTYFGLNENWWKTVACFDFEYWTIVNNYATLK